MLIEFFTNKKCISKKEELLELIRKLTPYKTNHELIRLGSAGDGGYLVPNDLEGITACFSAGVGKISDFERDCYNLGMKIYMADGSVNPPDFLDFKFTFTKKYISDTDGLNFVSINSWIQNSKVDDSDLILQMDIEGSEYSSIIAIDNSKLSSFRIIVVEVHNLHHLWIPEFKAKAEIFFHKLLLNHICVHIHPNNCFGIFNFNGLSIPTNAEFTFIRKDRVTTKEIANNFPHSLDSDNTLNSKVELPKIWYAYMQ
jgi:hypothetical protein